MKDRTETVLVADDDEDIARFVEINLRLEGFEVAVAHDGEQALQTTYEIMPDLVLLDVMMPKLDGFEVCQRLRSDARTRQISVIMLTARSLSADKVVGLTAGADDYIIKPFEPVELVARARAALRRSREMRDANPLTRLPGNVRVQEEVSEIVAARLPFALLYIDLDDFKAFNDHYGFLRGDEAIKHLADCITEAVRNHAGTKGFVGHIGGDDFVALVDPSLAEGIATEIIGRWDESAPSLYDPEHAAAGHIVIADRRGIRRRFPLMRVSIGVASNSFRPITSHWEASDIAAEMKQYAKRDSRSSFAVDRRRAREHVLREVPPEVGPASD